MRPTLLLAAALAVLSAAGCAAVPAEPDPAEAAVQAGDVEPAPEPEPADGWAMTGSEASHEPAAVTDPRPPEAARPDWLGTRVLPLRADGFGEVAPTPPELDDRRLPPPHLLPPPAGDRFEATVGPVPDAVAARSTWHPGCPVPLEDLRYLTVSFWGFDERFHTGELVVHASVAGDVVEVFERLHEARFPIEEMRVVAADELDLPPTGDGNNTGSFVCRSSVGATRWSDHAFGLAVDVNPFHNPYARGDLVIPELASSYVDRARHRPGMIQPGDVVTQAFAAVGWSWGGNWRSSKDWMHFSRSGR